MTFEDVGAIKITPMEFCIGTGIRPGCWIFDEIGPETRFYMYKAVRNEPAKYFINNGKVIHEFKHMKEYGETWIRSFDMRSEKPSWTLWTTWKNLDE